MTARSKFAIALALFAWTTVPARAQLIDFTSPGNPIAGIAATTGSATSSLASVGTVAGANNYPAAESPPNSIDNNTGTKYLNFAETNAGLIVTPGILGAVSAFQFTTANDAPERDPLTVSIEGTNDPNATTSLNSTWSLLYSGDAGLSTDPGRFSPGNIVQFSNTTSFESYRMLVLSVRNGAAANSFQFSEIGLGTAPVPEPTSLALAGVGLGLIVRRRFNKRNAA